MLDDRNRSVLLGGEIEGSSRHIANQHVRLGRFADWLRDENRHWSEPDFRSYAAFLRKRYRPATVKSYLQAVLKRYEALLADEAALVALLASDIRGGSLITEETRIERLRREVREAPRPSAKEERKEFAVFLTSHQVGAWLTQPDPKTPVGRRDLAAMGLALTTGVRESELVALDVDDLQHTSLGRRVVHVPAKPRCIERVIVPGPSLEWGVKLAEFWLAEAGITEGAVLRSFLVNRTLRPGRFAERGLQVIFGNYPIEVDGMPYLVKPNDCRRYFATAQFYSGVDIRLIQANLGFRDLNTVMDYIQPAEERSEETQPYEYDLTPLNLI